MRRRADVRQELIHGAGLLAREALASRVVIGGRAESTASGERPPCECLDGFARHVSPSEWIEAKRPLATATIRAECLLAR